MTGNGFRLNVESIWWLLMTAMRLMLGAWMVVNGLNHFVNIFPQPLGSTPQDSALLVTLIETGLFGVVKVVEVIGGALLIWGRFVPLGLVMLMPISVVIYYTDAFLQHRWNRIIYMGNDCMYFNVLLLVGYVRYYLPMLRYKAEVGQPADLKRIAAAVRDESPLS